MTNNNSAKKHIIKRIGRNTFPLYIMSFAKLILPLITLPYLTRILSTETYGVVSYLKSIMVYVQIVIDFGFMLSSTKEVVENKQNPKKLSKIYSTTNSARLLLGIISFIIYLLFICNVEILNGYLTFSILSFFPVFLTVFLPDFLFRGIEKMHIITNRFVATKLLSTIGVFLIVKDQNDINIIPILDIVGTIIAIYLTNKQLLKLNIKWVKCSFQNIINKLKKSSIYFLSSFANTLFGVFTTVIIGILLPSSDVAYWSVALSIISAIQNFYSPISDGIYPYMIESKSKKFILSLFKVFLPILLIGCIFSYVTAPLAVTAIAGDKYISSILIFRIMIPILFVSFFAIICGWPALGAIGKIKENTISTIIAGIFQVSSLAFLFYIDEFSLISIAISRVFTEFILFSVRFYYIIRYRKEFL